MSVLNVSGSGLLLVYDGFCLSLIQALNLAMVLSLDPGLYVFCSCPYIWFSAMRLVWSSASAASGCLLEFDPVYWRLLVYGVLLGFWEFRSPSFWSSLFILYCNFSVLFGPSVSLGVLSTPLIQSCWSCLQPLCSASWFVLLVQWSVVSWMCGVLGAQLYHPPRLGPSIVLHVW